MTTKNDQESNEIKVQREGWAAPCHGALLTSHASPRIPPPPPPPPPLHISLQRISSVVTFLHAVPFTPGATASSSSTAAAVALHTAHARLQPYRELSVGVM